MRNYSSPEMRLVLAVISILAMAVWAGCELTAIEGDDANYISFSGTAPDGRTLGFARNTIPMVDSTVVVRVMVADTIGTRAGQGLPSPTGAARVVWTVTDGSLPESTTEIGDFGISEVRWKLGTDASAQRITAALSGDGVLQTSATLSLSGRQLYPGPPVAFEVGSGPLQLVEGGSAPLSIASLRDKYGNEWGAEFFDILVQSSDSTVAQGVRGSSGETTSFSVRAIDAGNVTLTFTAKGRLFTDYDFRGLEIQTTVPVAVESFDGFPALFSAVSAGGEFACAVAADGTPASAGAVYCWGSNAGGRLGNSSVGVSTLSNPRIEYAVEGLPVGVGVRSLASGNGHTCAALDDGSVYCWGDNSSRQLGSFGNAAGANRALLDNPNAASAAETGFTDVAAGSNHTCVLGESGAVYCFGANSRGQLGNGDAGANQLLSQRVAGLDGVNVVSLADAGPLANHTCAISDTGAAWCWGSGANGEIGDGDAVDRTSAFAVGGSLSFADVATGSGPAGSGFTCGVTTSSELHCWGRRPAEAGGFATPTYVSSDAGSLLSAGVTHVCTVSGSSGEAHCFGAAGDGRLGNGVTNASQSFADPQQVLGGMTYVATDLGSDFSVGLTATGAAYAWGSNASRQLGTSSDQPSAAEPAAVVFSTSAL